MSAIFKSTPGQLLVIRSTGDQAPAGGLLTIDGLSSAGRDVLISSFDMSDQVSAQVTPTIGGPRYIYSFGQELSQVRVGLVTYPTACDEQGGAGINRLLSFYGKNRVSPTRIEPVSITFAGITIYGFVAGLTTRVSAGQGQQVIQANLSLWGWVDDQTLEQAGSGDSGVSVPETAPVQSNGPVFSGPAPSQLTAVPQ